MKKKMLMAALALSLTCSATAQYMGETMIIAKAASYETASGVVSMGKGEASITIQGNNNQTMLGKKFQVYKLFHAENAVGGESINYTFNEVYKTALQNVIGSKISKSPAEVTEYAAIDYIQSLNHNVVEGTDAEQTLEGNYSEFRYFIEELRNEIVRLGCASDLISVSEITAENNIMLTGLDYGYYIIDEVSENSGTHSASSLCMVNTANPNASVNLKSDFPSILKKIQEDDNKDIIGNQGWNDIADYEIGQTVPFKFESGIPNMNGYDTYYYAWHDVMDEALTLNSDSIQVRISDGTKEYVLKRNEYTLLEHVAGETFKLEIGDLKGIVDREFDQLDENGHNAYGQTVVLTYNATLNDQAADDTGRPGFENEVRLEYSNDPDGTGDGKTGFTPWDTVVCFTYKLNVLKTNNHDVALENAKFRLYSDEECQNEVYVKSTDNGYNIIHSEELDGTVPVDAAEMSSKEDGTFVIFGLDQGTYYLKETNAPDGYREIKDPIVLTVTPTFASERNSYVKGEGATEKTLQELEISAYIKQFLDGAYSDSTNQLVTNVEDGSGNLTVVNQVGSKLPVTGSSMTVLLLSAGVGMMIMANKVSDKKRTLNA